MNKKANEIKGTSRISGTAFSITLFTAVVYEVLLMLINPNGVSLTKVSMTLLLWISCFLAVATFIRQFHKIKYKLHKFGYYAFITLTIWNIISILRSVFDGREPFTTILGNNETSLALLVPFSLAFSYNKLNIKTINTFFIRLIKIGSPIFILYFIISKGGNNYKYYKAFSVILYGVFFLIPLIPFQKIKLKFIIFLGSVLLCYLALTTEYRVIILRISLLYFSIIAIYFYIWSKSKVIPLIAMLSISIPFIILIQSVVTEDSAFQKYRPETRDPYLIDDTRTFLYIEVFNDLQKSKELLTGKGSSGTYYSPYFDQYGGDTPHRLSVEVGILALLLKGGYIGVILNLTIFIIAIYLAFFRSNNHFLFCIGCMLVIHIFILFITNYIDYSIYNLSLWFFVGICLSKEMRQLNDIEIKNILQHGRIS